MTAEATDIHIREMQPSDASSIAGLHETEIDFGFISTLGVRFLTHLYSAMLQSDETVIFTAEAKGLVVGFCAISKNVGKMYKTIIRKKWWVFCILLLPKLFSIKVIAHCYETLRYPDREDTLDLPEAELISIAVSKKWAGQGIGKLLTNQAISRLRDWGVPRVRVAVLDSTITANKFYPKVGFKFHSQITNHGRLLNIYILDMEQTDIG
ncbi:MAG: GNAT family N-acetyltransferase [Phycisphaerae bacterium]|nr:GNAT family N-acetyltransferase [Phycisphaerae bacterium]